MSLPDDDNDTSMVEKMFIMKFMMEQQAWLIMALLARCGGDAKITKDELDFVRRTYAVDENVSSMSQVLQDVHLKLKLKV